MKKLTGKEAALRLVFMFCAVLVFTFFDWLVHSGWAYLSVPQWYFTNKIIYGTLWAWLVSLFFRKGAIWRQAAWIAGITVILLQIRYILYGYPPLFHAIILPEHFLFLYFASVGALKLLARVQPR
jgi:hypothetical protein